MKSTPIIRIAVCALFALAASASAYTVDVTMSVDDEEIVVGQTTTMHVAAEVIDGVPDNGIWAYALNILNNVPGIVQINSVEQLGGPDPFFSDPGSIGPAGLIDVYGGDGDFFIDQNRGIGGSFEILALQVEGLKPGETTYSATIADSANALGIPDGFLLQEPGGVDVDFGTGVTIRVIPEPAAALLWLGSMPLLTARPRRRA